MTSFAELGIYRILGGPETRKDVAAFVQQWLGSLLDYDSRRKTDLVATLAEYLDCGGNYDQTADALMIHRSTLRYRLRRIRDLGGLDLTDVDTRLSLHLATRAWKIIDW
jgi:DNA-binding PucR family transcriptional regulator